MAPRKHGTTSGSEPEPSTRETRSSRGTKRKATENAGTEGNGDATGDGEPVPPSVPSSSENTATRKTRGTRAASQGLSQPANGPLKKISLKVSKKAALQSATESAEEANSSSGPPTTKRRRIEKRSTTTSSADAEDAILKQDPSSIRQSSPKRQHADDSSYPSLPAKRQRIVNPLDDDSSIVVEHDILEPTPFPTQNSEHYLNPSSSNQPSPSPYPMYEAPVSSSESHPKWKEPALAASLEDQLKHMYGDQYPFFSKKEYVMEKEADGLFDVLGEDRKLLLTKSIAPTRGRGRGRGRGGRGRGRGIIGNSRPIPETSDVPIATVQGRGRGGYRVKKSEDPRIQALYHRRAAMRNQYRSLANFQRAALEALGEKSIEILKADPEAHSKLPAFDQTGEKLGELFEKVIRETNARLRIHGDFLIQKKEQDQEYERMMQEFAAIDDEDEVLVEFFNALNHISKQIAAGASDEEVPFDPLDGGYKIIEIQRPRKAVALEGTPYSTLGDWPATAGEHVSTVGDTELEQHPANFKRSIHPDDRKKFQQNLLRQRQMSSSAKEKKKGAQPKSKSLLAPTDAVNVQLAPTPGEVSEMEQRNDSDDESSSGAEPGPADALDKYGVKLPNKPAPKNGYPPNNRFVVNPHFEYEQIEIGNRSQKNKRTNTGESQYVGKDANPNPKAFHFDQRATGQYNSARNKLGDLDEDLVAIFKVHPVYGLAIPGSVNPTYEDLIEANPEDKQTLVKPRTDWSQPLEPTHPVVFIESGPSGVKDDRSKKVYHTSRSVRFVRAQQLFNEQSAKSKIHRVLKEIFEEYKGITLNTIFRDPTVEPSPTPPPPSPKGKGKEIEVQESLLPSLMEAVNEAKRLLTEKEVAEARMKMLRTVVRRYDPVRDEFTSTYADLPPPPVEDRTALSLLANLAESSRYQRPPPQTYHQPFVAPPPQPWGLAGHQPIAMSHSHGHPQPYHQPMQPPRPQVSGSLRQLLPAPPQGPAPPKPHQYRY